MWNASFTSAGQSLVWPENIPSPVLDSSGGADLSPTSRLDIYLSHLSRENVRLMTSPEGDTWLTPRRKHNSGDSVRGFSVYFNFIPFDFLLLFPGRQQTRPALSVFSPLESLPPPSDSPLLNTKIQILNLLRELSKQNLLLFKIFVENITWWEPGVMSWPDSDHVRMAAGAQCPIHLQSPAEKMLM